MSDTQLQDPMVDEAGGRQDDREGNSFVVALLSIAAAIAVPLLLFLSLQFVLDVFSGVSDLVTAFVAILVGVVGIFFVYTAVDKGIDRFLPPRLGERIRPYAWSGPAIVLLSVFLIYPAINVIQLSFTDRFGEAYVGWENYAYVFTDGAMLRSLRNTLGWIIV